MTAGPGADVVVVGAGPAGAAAALGLLSVAPDAHVVLLDRDAFPRDKACGDGVAPHVLDVLVRVGVHDLLADRVPVQRLRLGFVGGEQVRGQMRRAAYVVPRVELDARIVSAAVARGAQLCRGQVREVVTEADGVTLRGSGVDVRARVVVGADGAHSTVRSSLGLPASAPGHTALALRGYAPVRGEHAGEQVIAFSRGRWPAYAWSFPVGDGRANVGYGELLTHRGGGRGPTRAQLFERLDELLPGAAEGGTAWRGHHLPLSTARPRQPDGRVLLAGDAMSLVNPMTGEGIYYAVLSGVLAGRAAGMALGRGDPASSGRLYRGWLSRELGRHLRHTRAAVALARAPLVVPAGVRAARHDQEVFDDLVELGLGRGLITPRVLRGLARRLPTRWSPTR